MPDILGYDQLIRRYPALAARLHRVITVRRVAGAGYAVEFNQLPNAFYATLPDAQEGRRELITNELRATYYGFL